MIALCHGLERCQHTNWCAVGDYKMRNTIIQASQQCTSMLIQDMPCIQKPNILGYANDSFACRKQMHIQEMVDVNETENQNKGL